MPSLSAIVMLAVVSGGTPTQRSSVEKLVQGLPDCLTKPGGMAIPISIIHSGDLNASYSALSDSLTIHDSLLDDATRKSAVEELASTHCADPTTIKMFDDTRRVLVHELLHGYFRHKLAEPAGPGMLRSTIHAEGLLGTRFRQAQHVWANDESRLEDAGKTISPELKPLKCQLHAMLDKDYRNGGTWMPSRFPNDRHVFDDKMGSEYFAIAAEMLIFDGTSFCSTFSESEEKWLSHELGDCFKSLMKGNPCSRSGAKPPAGAGMLRD